MSDVSDSEPTKFVVEERAKRTTRLPAKHNPNRNVLQDLCCFNHWCAINGI